MQQSVGTAQPLCSLVIGGPFSGLLNRLNLLGPDRLPTSTAALIFVALAWLVPGLLAAAEGTAWLAAPDAKTFLRDYSAYARFIICIWTFLAMERFADRCTKALTSQFMESGLVRPEQVDRFEKALVRADQRTSWWLVEAVVLVLAYLISMVATYARLSVLQDSWLGANVNGYFHLSGAGRWAIGLSFPLFWFLLLRWLWRFWVWTILLWELARLDLLLVPTHPDRSAGLGFLALFPATFKELVFALSCLAAATALEEVVFVGVPMQSLVGALAFWLVVVLVIFMGPLLVFFQRLQDCKTQALLDIGVLASVHNRSFETLWMGKSRCDHNSLGSPDISSLADLGGGFGQVRSIQFVPGGLESARVLILSALIPWLALAATQMPLVDLLQTLAKFLL